jgi:thioredoxin reductase
MLDVIIIGAGPYGISLASYAVRNGLSYKLLGYPMDFWKNQMPQNMFIRTPYELVRFPDPKNELSIHHFAKETGATPSDPLPRPVFVDYAFWYAQKTGVQFTPEWVNSVTKEHDYFVVKTEENNIYKTKNVIIATGIQEFKYVPEIFQNIALHLVSHTTGYTTFEQFKDKDVIVIGSGQSAWEASALLHEANSNVQLIYRKEHPVYGGSKSGEVILRFIGNIFYKLPQMLKKKLWNIASETVPIARFLRPYVEGKVFEISGTKVESVIAHNEKVHLKLSNGEEKIADHVIVASGFKINLDKVPFIYDLKNQIIREEGQVQFPKLNQNFESSIKGLYFAGPLSSHSHGPTFRFILGLGKTAITIIGSIARKK